jgi:hypothetical protein
VTQGDVHDESSVGMEIELEILGNATPCEGHEIGSHAGGVVEAFVAVGEARFCAGCGDATVIGDSGELLG